MLQFFLLIYSSSKMVLQINNKEHIFFTIGVSLIFRDALIQKCVNIMHLQLKSLLLPRKSLTCWKFWDSLCNWRSLTSFGIILAHSFTSIKPALPPWEAVLLFQYPYLGMWDVSVILLQSKFEVEVVFSSGLLDEECQWTRGEVTSLSVILKELGQ